MILTILLSIALMAALFSMLFLAVALIQDKRLFGTAPKDIQERIRPREKERFPGARALGWGLMIIVVAAFPVAFIIGGYDGICKGWGFGSFFIRYFIILMLLKVFDIVFLDYFLLTKSRFFQHYYPETEGAAGYHQFGFNRRSHMIQTVLFFPIALAAAGIATAVSSI